uniref:Uncharacterized protein n=1 Tax=Lepeophtheirus salmonis TaxID=72036 RepID=A0A0K2UN34_LEPSM
MVVGVVISERHLMSPFILNAGPDGKHQSLQQFSAHQSFSLDFQHHERPTLDLVARWGTCHTRKILLHPHQVQKKSA